MQNRDNRYANLTAQEIMLQNDVRALQNIVNPPKADNNTSQQGTVTMQTQQAPGQQEPWADYVIGGVVIVGVVALGMYLLRKHKKKGKK